MVSAMPAVGARVAASASAMLNRTRRAVQPNLDSHPRASAAQVVALADVHTGVAQERVSDGEMELDDG